MPARSISLAKPEVENGAPRSLTNMKGDLASRFKALNARNSSPRSGCVARCPALGPTEVQGAGLEFNVAPLKAAKLSGPQAMPEGNQDHRGIPLPPAIALGGLDQLFDFTLS